MPPIHALWGQVHRPPAAVAALEAKLDEPSKHLDNSSLPLSRARSEAISSPSWNIPTFPWITVVVDEKYDP